MKIELGRWLLQITLEKFEGIIGINSYFSKNKQVGFLDLDKTTQEEAEKIIQKLQEKHKLGDAILIKSSKGNHHAIFFDLKPFWFWLKINIPINPQFSGYSCFRQVFVLRLSSKTEKFIEYIKTIPNISNNQRSLNHIKFIENFFNVKLNKTNSINNGDDNVLIELYNARVSKN